MHEYDNIMESERKKLSEIEGKVLIDFLVNVVEPEINIAYLYFTDCVYAIHGAIGSELLQVRRTEVCDIDYEKLKIMRFKPYSIFINRKINQARSIGEAWNGHGFEISFKGLYDNTMIIQSIYAGDVPEGFDDCIRLGVGQYYHSNKDSLEFEDIGDGYR